jgi:uncharacterized protein involved in type VI secretion and phage assembly
LLQCRQAYLSAMASPLPIDPDTITVASAASGVAPSDLATALYTVQDAGASAVEATSPQEHAAMAAVATTTSGATTAPTDIAAALAALQSRVVVAEAEAQRARAAAATLELQLAAVLRVPAPPPRPATAAASAPAAAPR